MTARHRLYGLYVITDAGMQTSDKLCVCVGQALQGGARLVQYRDKSGDEQLQLDQGRQLVELCTEYKVPLIVNDDVELALEIKASGVHLGRDDSGLQQARERLGNQAIIGVSCYNEWQRAVTATESGADYVAFGSFFASKTKPDAVAASLDLLQRARQELNIPVAAIGGITPDNAAGLIQAGADMLAVIHGVFAQPDLKNAAQQYSELFQ